MFRSLCYIIQLMSTENFRERLRKQAESAGEVNHLEASVGNQPVLPHIAIVSTALAIAGLEISAGRNNSLRARMLGKSTTNLPYIRALAKEKRNNGLNAKSRDESPYIIASINTRYTLPFSRLPIELSRAVIDDKHLVISESKLEIAYPQEQSWLRTHNVGVVAVHCGYTECSKTDVDKIANVTDTSDFDDLFALIYDTEEVEEERFYYRGDLKNMIKVDVVTNDPERHFNMHEAMGVSVEQLGIARASFNAIATVSEIPLRVATI